MGLNLSKALLPNTKGLILLALATSLVALGETMPTDAGVEASTAARETTSFNGHVRTSNDVRSDKEERGLDLKSVASEVAESSKVSIPVYPEVNLKALTPDLEQTRATHEKLMLDGLSVLKQHDDVEGQDLVLLESLTTKFGSDAKLASFLFHLRDNDQWGVRAHSLSDLLIDGWIQKGVTPKEALDRLVPNTQHENTFYIFDDPLLVIMDEFATKYASHTNLDAEDVFLTALATRYSGIDRVHLLEHLRIKRYKDLESRLYHWQLQKWDSPTQAFLELGLTKEKLFESPQKLEFYLDFLMSYERKTEGRVLLEKDLVDIFKADFGETYSKALQNSFASLNHVNGQKLHIPSSM